MAYFLESLENVYIIKFCFNYVSLDIDECMTSGLCGEHGTCNNTAGSYHCLCDNGWTGDHCETGEKYRFLLLFNNKFIFHV